LITKGLHNLMQSREVDKILETFVCNLIYWMLMTFIIIAAMSQLGIQTTSLIAVMGAAGLAVGLALQGALGNFAAGVLIVMFRPYRVGDYVEAAGIAGTILQVQILTTMLKTADNKLIVVPNGQIMSGIITNYSAHRILKDPECLIAVSELADSSVNFTVRPWVKGADYWGVKFDLTEAIKKRFDKDGISFPFPQQDVHLYNNA
jgi:small conductance mechanosensitive channel